MWANPLRFAAKLVMINIKYKATEGIPMLKITCEGVYYKNGGFVPAKDGPAAGLPAPEKAREGTMAHAILKAHNTGDNMEELAIRFPRHHLCGHHPDRPGLRHAGVPPALRAHQLPQLPVRRGGHHQRGRPCVRPVGGEEVRRRVCPRPPERHSFLYAGAVRRPRQDDPGLRLPHPLRRLRHHGHRRGRSGAGPAAFIKNL